MKTPRSSRARRIRAGKVWQVYVRADGTEILLCEGSRTICDLQDREEFALVTDSQDVAALRELLRPVAGDFDGCFVHARDGEYVEVYGFCGVVPALDKPLYSIKAP